MTRGWTPLVPESLGKGSLILHLERRVRECHEQSEKQIFQAERTVHKKAWNTEHAQTGVRSEIPSVLWPRSMGFILRAVAGYEDFGSVHILRVDWGEETSGRVSQASLAVSLSSGVTVALGSLTPCLVFLPQLSFSFLGWHLSCMVSCRCGMLKTHS